MKIALISDELTDSCLQKNANIKFINIFNYKFIFKFWKPDFLFVESAWHGRRKSWKFKIATYPDYPERNNGQLKKVVVYAKELGIPTVFWNKEDGVHFDRFIDSAKLFDHIFTVDENCIPRYSEVVDTCVTVNPLMFAVEPSFHSFTGFNFKFQRANFVGSYSQHVHSRRQVWQDSAFKAACDSGLGLTAFDRNSKRKSSDYRYPPLHDLEVKPAVPYPKTSQVYKDYLVSLNVNTIEDSKTMFSRRLVEILACGGIAVTNSTPAVSEWFSDYCHAVDSYEQGVELFKRFKMDGSSNDDLERARAGAEYVAQNHTWNHRLEEIYKIIGL
ncbi:MAG: glycosyltransferase [Pseudomonadota bacterium]|nr:glycosyltransferase [Pseudomonadota bacterium]